MSLHSLLLKGPFAPTVMKNYGLRSRGNAICKGMQLKSRDCLDFSFKDTVAYKIPYGDILAVYQGQKHLWSIFEETCEYNFERFWK